MRVAFVLSRCSNLGPFIVARDIVEHLYDMVEHIDVFYLRESLERLDFRTTTIKINFFEKISFSEYDIIHSHGFVADAYLAFHNAKKKTKVITTIHQRIAPDYSMKYNKLFGHFFEKIWCTAIKDFSSVVTLTKSMAAYYTKILKRHNIQYIYNGISSSKNDGIIDKEDEDKIILLKSKYVIIGVTARLIYLKGIDQIIKSLPELKSFALVIVGDGMMRKSLYDLAAQLGVEEKCLFLGYRRNALDYYKYFDIYAMTSRSEGFGLSVIEAASKGVPVVCSNLPVFNELFDDEIVRFELENVSSLVTAFNKALKDKHSLSKKIYDTYCDKYHASKMSENYFIEYKHMLKN